MLEELSAYRLSQQEEFCDENTLEITEAIKVRISKGLKMLYKSEPIQEMLRDFHGRDPNTMMAELKHSISDAGSILDPGRWGLVVSKD